MLFRKMLRDMYQHKAQFIAIFLMIFLGVFIYSGVNSEWNGLRVHSENFYKESNLSDVWLIGSSFTKEEALEMKKDASIQEVERRAVIPATLANHATKKITVYIPERNQLSQMKIMDGEEFSIAKTGIWLDQSYAEENNIQVGDHLFLVINGIHRKDEVKGLVLHPEFIYQQQDGGLLPDHKNTGYAFLSAQSIPNQEQIPYTQLLMKTTQPSTMEQVSKDRLHRSNVTCIQKRDLPSYATLESEIVQHKAFGNVFPIVFLLIAALTTLTTVSKLILHQRLQIGILKALGFTNCRVLFHYVSHVLCITTLGAMLGFIAGPYLLPKLIYPMMQAMYILPSLQAVPVEESILMVVGSVLLCFFAAVFMCRKQVKEPAAITMRPTIHTYKATHSPLHKFWQHLSFYTQWNLRDVLRNKIRTCMAVIGVAGCMGLFYCALGIQDTMHQMIVTLFEEQQRYDVRIDLEEQVDISSIKQRSQGEAMQEGAIEVKHQNVQKTASLLVLEGTTYRKLQDTSQHYVELPRSGIALSNNIAKQFDVQVGDRLSWRILGDTTWSSSIIKNILYTPVGQGITISKQEFEHLGYPFTATSVIGKDASFASIKGVKNIQYLQKDVRGSMNQMMEGMNLLIAILILGAVLLGIVVLYNIGTFAYMEKIREMATLKVLGFQTRQVKKLLRQQNVWLSAMGILMGIPFGYLLMYTVFSTIGDTMDLIIRIHPLSYVICIVGTLGISMLVMYIVSRRTAKIDMVSALKAVE